MWQFVDSAISGMEATMQALPFNIESLNTSCVATGDRFTITRPWSSIMANDRLYVLLEGVYDSVIDRKLPVYAVVTEDKTIGLWRFAHIINVPNEHGYFFLSRQSKPPAFVNARTTDAKVAIQLMCTEQSASHRRGVLKPYAIPIAVGVPIAGRTIAKFGAPIYHGDGISALVPVQYTDLKHGFVECAGHTAKPYVFTDKNVARLIEHSTKMLVIRNGQGNFTWHIGADEDGESILIKTFFGQKAGWPDKILR